MLWQRTQFRPKAAPHFSLPPEGVVPASTEVGELGSKNEMAHIKRIMHDMKVVVDHIVNETYEGLTISRTLPAGSPRN